MTSAASTITNNGMGNSRQTIDRVVEYYDTTLLEYRLVLSLDDHLGIHYGYYDQGHRTYPQASRNMNLMLAEKLGIGADTRVLDAGCGVGGSAIWLASHYGCHVTGITVTPSQSRMARQLARKHCVVERTSFLVQDYCKTEFPDSHFDVVWGLESVCYADDKRRFLQEAFRVLKPGGRLIVADGFRTRRDNTRKNELLVRKWLHGWAVADLDTVDEFSESVNATGYINLCIDDITSRVMPFAQSVRRRALMLLPVAEVLRWLRIYNRVKVNNGISAILQHRALKLDLWRYMVFLAQKP